MIARQAIAMGLLLGLALAIAAPATAGGRSWGGCDGAAHEQSGYELDRGERYVCVNVFVSDEFCIWEYHDVGPVTYNHKCWWHKVEVDA